MRDPAGTFDRLERKQPARLNWMHFVRAIPGYVDQFKTRVPDNFYAQHADGVVEVACPCGVVPGPRCTLLVPTGCACGRTFIYTGNDVRVYPERDS